MSYYGPPNNNGLGGQGYIPNNSLGGQGYVPNNSLGQGYGPPPFVNAYPNAGLGQGLGYPNQPVSCH